MLDNSVKYQGKLMIQTWKMSINLISGPILDPRFFFMSFTSNSSYKLVQAIILCNLKGKLMNQTWENDKKPNLRLDFDPFGPKLALSNLFLVALLSTTC